MGKGKGLQGDYKANKRHLGGSVKKIETELFIRLWNTRGFRDVGLMCGTFDLTHKQVLRKVRNLRYGGKCLKTGENKTLGKDCA